MALLNSIWNRIGEDVLWCAVIGWTLWLGEWLGDKLYDGVMWTLGKLKRLAERIGGK